MSYEINVQEITVQQAKELADKGVMLVDVREKEEVAAAAYDVANIIYIPLSEFERRYDEVPDDEEVIMVCRSGKRSFSAAAVLQSKGYTKVVNMQGGILGWQQYNYPIK